MSKSRFLFFFDLAMLIALGTVEVVRLTGTAIHEWLGIALIAVFAAHLHLAWTWIENHTRRALTPAAPRDRTNYLLNFGLFASMTIVIFSGIMISEVALPALGMAASSSGAWRGIHSFASNLVLAFAGLHVALNWDWIISTSRHLFRRLTNERTS